MVLLYTTARVALVSSNLRSELKSVKKTLVSLQRRANIDPDGVDLLEVSVALLIEVAERHNAQLAPVVINVEKQPTLARYLDMVRCLT